MCVCVCVCVCVEESVCRSVCGASGVSLLSCFLLGVEGHGQVMEDA